MNFSCELAIALNSRPAQIAYAFEEEIRKETQRDVNDVSLCGFLFFSFFFLYICKRSEKNRWQFYLFFSAIRTSLGNFFFICHFVIFVLPYND